MFLHVKQTGSGVDYISQFDDLMHQLLAHDPLVNLVLLIGKFVDGLREDIRAVVILHRPKDLDTANSLAILQEEVLMGHGTRDYKKLDSFYQSRHAKQTLQSAMKPTDLKPADQARFDDEPVKLDDKLSDLMAYHKAKGLCFKCGGKWRP
jgi:hypothetical protein